jgi:signal transduction histidine kinase
LTTADRVSDLSHELRAPLATIRAYTELLIDEVDDGDPEMRRLLLETIDQSSRLLTELIANLTDLARIELGYFRPRKRELSLRDVADDAIAHFEAQARQKNVALNLESPPGLPTVTADRDMMDMLLKALMSNAIKFSASGGEVEVSLGSDKASQTISVRDRGPGIAPQDLPHIFEAFYRGRATVEEGLAGLGIGLTVVKAIVEAHEGRVDVESDEELGTRFIVRLPCR